MASVLYAGGGSFEDPDRGPEGGDRPGGEEDQQCTGPLHVLAHAWPLPVPPPKAGGPGVHVVVAGSGRSLPTAKHSSWLRDRKPLDELKAQVRSGRVLVRLELRRQKNENNWFEVKPDTYISDVSRFKESLC